MFHRPIEFWIAIATGMAIVYARHAEKPLLERMLMVGISGGIGYSLTPDLAAHLGRSEVLVAMVLTSFGYFAIDMAFRVFNDREFIVDLIRARLGKGDDK